MEALFRDYETATLRQAKHLEEVRTEILEWIKRNLTSMPSLVEVARLEAMHAQRMEIVTELLAVEKRFMDGLLALHKSNSESTAASILERD